MGRNRINEPLNENDRRWVLMFRNNLKYILKTKHSSIKELSKKLNISYYEMNRYIDGTVRPDDSVVKRIADAVGCTVDDLIDETYCPWNYGLSDEEIKRNGRKLK